MNTKNLKAYAPKARKQFIEAIKKRAAHFGIYEDRIAEVRIEGGAAIIEGRAFTRKEGEQRKRLERKLTERASATYQEKYDMFTREIAYTWFNRLAAIRYMEIHDYFDHGFRVLSHPTNQGDLPEILNHASDVAESLNLDKDHIIELQLAGDKEEELYRELLLGQCHQLAKIMPQIFKGLAFETIDDATELLLPNNLTKTDSILKGLINDIPEEDWQEIEVIGWLYQFYISEHKDSVIGKVVKSEDIPAATQLFTPNWIVKYLVQNSVGRQWLATYPDSELKGKMEYYIEPAEQSDEVIAQLKAITPTSIDPEEIKVLDPACGSGHILVEVYEVLREIYLERGYRLREIPELILTKNIYGLDIDDRAAQLAGFALMMKAREDDRRIFQRVEDGEVSLNVFSLQSTEHLDIPKLWKALDLEGNQQTGSTGGLFDSPEEFVEPTGVCKEYFELLQILKSSFMQSKTLGSLIQIDSQHLINLVVLKKLLEEKRQSSDPVAKQAANEVSPIINQSIALAQMYDVVVANPPYLGPKGMNGDLKEFVKVKYPESKSDLFACFIQRSISLVKVNSFLSMITMQSWMFLSSYTKLRQCMFGQSSLENLFHVGPGLFPELGDYNVLTSCFVFRNSNVKEYKSRFIKANESPSWQFKINSLTNKNSFFDKKLGDIENVPEFPLVYWLSDAALNKFVKFDLLGNISPSRVGLQTGDNELFVKAWHEVNFEKVGLNLESIESSKVSNKKWFPYNKGGNYRKWYGNNEFVVNWKDDGKLIRAFTDDKGKVRSRPQNTKYYFKEGIVYSLFGFENFGVRYKPNGFIFDVSGSSLFPIDNLDVYLAFLSSNVAFYYLKALAPTVNFQAGDVNRLPVPPRDFVGINKVKELANKCIEICRLDWDSNEISWDFKSICTNLSHDETFQSYVNKQLQLNDLKRNQLRKYEEDINEIFLDLFEINQEVSKKVNDRDLTIKKLELGELLNKILSYSVGCMMGRYSLDRDGLVYAHFGNEGFKALLTDGAYKTFPADDDGIIPLSSEEWLFDDDATTRFNEFVKTVWGAEHLSDNLEFVAESLCLHALKPKKGEGAMDTIRRYFSTQFFKDHCKTYKKRPIYWLFSSGKEKAFECLVYLHRYNEGTLSRMRTEYVTPLMGKCEAQHNLLSEQQLQATGTESRGIEKDLKSLEKKQAELRAFDEQLKHYAEKRITLDLDDGVKANYGKFGNLLSDVKAIHGEAVK